MLSFLFSRQFNAPGEENMPLLRTPLPTGAPGSAHVIGSPWIRYAASVLHNTQEICAFINAGNPASIGRTIVCKEAKEAGSSSKAVAAKCRFRPGSRRTRRTIRRMPRFFIPGLKAVSDHPQLIFRCNQFASWLLCDVSRQQRCDYASDNLSGIACDIPAACAMP